MVEVSVVFITSAFIAGLLMFLAPCTLPLVPAYLAFISGVKLDKAGSEALPKELRHTIQKNAVAFVIGFSIVFIVFGILAGFFGSFVGSFRGLLTQVGGVFIILFGFLMLDVVHIKIFQSSHSFTLPSSLKPGNPISAFIIGSIFALGWTPCVGPILAAILLLATTEATVLSGALLLFVFSLGLSIPFLLTAFLYARASHLIARFSYISKGVSYVGGIFLILIGLLLISNNFGLTVEYGYTLFETLGFEGLFDHL